MGALLDHGVSLCLALVLAFRTCWATFQTENNVRSAPASSALILASHQSHNARTTNRHVCSRGERTEAQRRTKVNFSRTMMQALELPWQKGTYRDKVMLNSEEIKPVALTIIELRLSEGIS